MDSRKSQTMMASPAKLGGLPLSLVRSLWLSLLMVALVSIGTISWILNSFSGHTNQNAYLQITQHLAEALESHSPITQLMELVEQKPTQPIEILARNSFSGDDPTDDPFSGNAFVRQTDRSLGYYAYLTSAERFLKYTPSVEEDQSLAAVLTIVFYSCVTASLLLWLSPLLHRLSTLRRAAKRFGAGHLESRIKPARFSYIGDIETEFNRMAQRIQTLIEDNKLLSLAASHELRTPLTRLDLTTQTLLNKKPTAAQTKHLNRMSGDLAEMCRLVDTMLDFSELGNSINKAQKTPVELATLVTECLSYYLDGGLQISASITDSDTKILGNTNHLRLLINNILQNAEKFGKSQIVVSVTCSRSTVTLSVSDDGDGIPEDQRTLVTQPFKRGRNIAKISDASTRDITTGDHAQSPKTGYGLGLAVVHRIVQWQDAKLVIDRCEILLGAKIEVIFKR